MSGCVTVPPKPLIQVPLQISPVTVNRYSALVRLDPRDYPAFDEDLDTTSLHAAAFQSLSYYQSLPDNQLFVLGTDTYTVNDLPLFHGGPVKSFGKLLRRARNGCLSALSDQFAIYQSVGADPERTVIFSSYYEPTISARLNKEGPYRYPLYSPRPHGFGGCGSVAF